MREVSDWPDFIASCLLSQSTEWDNFQLSNPGLPPIEQIYFATKYSSRDGPTKLSKKALEKSTIKPLLEYFGPKPPRTIWVMIEFMPIPESSSDSEERDEISLLLPPSPPKLKSRRRKTVKVYFDTYPHSTWSKKFIFKESNFIDLLT
jgi:hypothetical protein